MWFAGESVRYYYGGHVLAALLARLTATPARYAYNLALAGFYAAAVTAAYGLAAAIAANHDASPRLAGGLAAFLFGVAGNLFTAGRIVLWALPESLARPLVGAFGLPAEALAWTPGEFYYWDATRVIEGTINEFPLFAYLNGDLHAHMMSTTFLLLGVALLYAYWETPEAETRRRRLLVIGLLPPLAGYLGTVNTWSFPSLALGLPFLTLTFAPARPWTLLPARVREAVPPIATAFTVTGAVVGVGLAAGGDPAWAKYRQIVLLWLLVPFVGGGIAYATARTLRSESIPESYAVPALAGVVGVLLANIEFALLGPVLLAGWLLLRSRVGVGFETVLILAGAGLVVLVEYVYIAEPSYAGTRLARLNTVFKTYAQVWALWAPAAAVAVTRLVAAGRDAAAFPALDGRRVALFGRVLLVLLVLSTGVYAVHAIPSHGVRRGAPPRRGPGHRLHRLAGGPTDYRDRRASGLSVAIERGEGRERAGESHRRGDRRRLVPRGAVPLRRGLRRPRRRRGDHLHRRAGRPAATYRAVRRRVRLRRPGRARPLRRHHGRATRRRPCSRTR
ncbi:hypothetical protein BRD04_04165 [Halobacteriales archaeon QS_9_67_17]|nr:MAG: hypothetical protein BRD04_04165 [Halobacteriales archaeon QS_9_67_17]